MFAQKSLNTLSVVSVRMLSRSVLIKRSISFVFNHMFLYIFNFPTCANKAFLDAKKITVDPLNKKIQLDECILMSHEIIELAGKKVKESNKRSLLYLCPNCSFRIYFLGSGDGDLSLCDLQYCHVTGCQSKPIIGTNYNWRQLASTLAPFVYAKTSAGQDLSSLDMKHVLREIVAGPIFALQKNTLARAKEHAIEIAVGLKKKEEIVMMNALVQCLQKKVIKWLVCIQV